MLRLDQLLVHQQLAATRTQAAKMLEQGRVYLNKGGHWQVASKPGLKLPEETLLRVEAAEEDQYVSRGALKLKAAIEAGSIQVHNQIALDIGQSTGGFTDYLLQAGVASVVGIDVGHSQLHPRLQSDPRVRALEKVNARYLTPDQLLSAQLPAKYGLIVMDISFISQTLVLPQCPNLMADQGWLITLVKPQFEVGKEHINKHGLVTDTRLYEAVRSKIESKILGLGLSLRGWLASPIQGGDGNNEFLCMAQKIS
ncbi:TlyA family RNA methyltransferase [Marinospirillum sp. MEB164]|uniref:TlyA family RNA methyltransferase n=1 Tax=Marinospirillum alkalitolerans TaxID=3123374 RepID=A0ABW8PZR8_9GAMM